MKKFILILIATSSLFGCKQDDDFFYGSQSDLTGTWISKTSKLNDYEANSNTCEIIIINEDGSSVWTDCENRENENLIFKGLNENVNFEVDEVEFQSWVFHYGRFLSQNEIEITKVSTHDETKYTTVYTFTKQ